MGYRLHATIPNVPEYDTYLELGKQYDVKWDSFNNNWFGQDRDFGMICYEDLNNFYDELVEINNEIIKQNGQYYLYNLHELKRLIDIAISQKYCMLFTSY